MIRPPPISTLFPYTTLFRSASGSTTTPSTCCTSRTAPTARSSATTIATSTTRSEEHTSELQSPDHLVCRLLLEKKNETNTPDDLYPRMDRRRATDEEPRGRF